MGSGPINMRGAAAQRAERQAKVWEMSLSGYTERQIAAELGISQSTVNRIVTSAIENRKSRPREQIIERELAKLDDLETHVRRVLTARHVMIRGDGVVREYVPDPVTGMPMVYPDGHPMAGEMIEREIEDDSPVLAAADRLIKIAERRSKLQGLDEPAKVEQTTYNYEVNGIDSADLR